MKTEETPTVDEIKRLSLDVFESESKAEHWLRTSNPVLKGKAPMELLDSPKGREKLRIVLIRIADGTFG